MKRVFTILFLVASFYCNAQYYTFGFVNTGKTWYFSNSGSDAANGLTIATPRQTLTKLQTMANDGTIHAGDKICFKRGDTFLAPDQLGGVNWWTIYGGTGVTGTATAHIRLTTYGTASAAPNFMFPHPTSVGIESRAVFTFYGVDYIDIDGLSFIDTNFPVNDKVTPAYTSEAVYFGGDGWADANNCSIRNSYMTNIGNGVNIKGNGNSVIQCSFVDMKNIVSTLSPNYEDYGATGVTIAGDDNSVIACYLKGCWAESIDFGWNGGAVEAYGASNRIKILYNTVIDCSGLIEFGSGNGGVSADHLFAYNLLINNGMLTYANLSGTFTLDAKNIQYVNNTILENDSSRFSGPNAGRGINPSYWSGVDAELFNYNSTPSDTIFRLKNNIIQLSTGIDVMRGSASAYILHLNNVYKLSGGGVLNYTIGGSEATTSSAIFTNTTNADPNLWDYSLLNSTYVNFGISNGLVVDHNGKFIIGAPDAGYLER